MLVVADVSVPIRRLQNIMRYLWYSMYGFVTTLAIYALFFRSPAPVEPTPDQPTPEPPPVSRTTDDSPVQIALILDTSSSMDGLVDQARTQLWEMVAELQTTVDGDERAVSVALYQYGNSRLPRDERYIEQLTPLTTDLDQVTVKLHNLTTMGGKEYAPTAIVRAVEDLEWNDDDSVEKVIVIAGNEGFGQGPVSPGKAFQLAERSGIRVVPIFCANRGASRTALSSWRQASELAGIDFESIDPDREVVKLDTPFDQEIMKKYKEYEKTRVYSKGYKKSRYAGEAAQYLSPEVAVDRAVVQTRQVEKGDLVNAYGSGKLNLDSAALPASLANKSDAEKKAFLEQRRAKQQQLKDEIAELQKKRESHIQRSAPAASEGSSLGRSVKQQLKNY